jgi:23S rRNA (cytidine1920-2'-O)/16S rRNA (cytidine1409-2'-O)-methyltransferase
MRADQLLVTAGLAPTRSAAQRLIARGAVRWRGPAGWAVPRKAGEDLPDGCVIELIDDAELRFVSRGGLKLEGALAHAGLDVSGLAALDVGQSTGGFTDVLLQRGAARVVGIDVGHGQLHPRLRADARVRALEGVNARHVDAQALGESAFDLIVGDLSFISLTLVLPALDRASARHAADAGEAAVRAPAAGHRQGRAGEGRGVVRPRRGAHPRVLRRSRAGRARLVSQRHRRR